MRSLFKLFLCCSFLAAFSLNSAKSQTISPEAEISLLTCGPGEELFEAFGHSAIRVHDPALKIDYVYNYGIFDFNQPNFYLNFVKGLLNYKLGVSYYSSFLEEYKRYNRSVYEQVLQLSPEQKQAFVNFLVENSKPENQYYLYDYFFNNCATKIRDVLDTVLGPSVIFKDDHLETAYTIRELIRLYAANSHPWGSLGIDIGLGARIDQKTQPREYMYLPDYLRDGFANATNQVNGQALPLVKETRTVFKASPQPITPSPFSPKLVFWSLLLLLALVSWRDYKSFKNSTWLDVLLFSITGLLGILLFLLWVATDHYSSAWNYNLLWAFPLHLPVVLLLLKKEPPSWVFKYFLIYHIFLLFILMAWTGLPQSLNLALLPVVLCLAIRSYLIYRHRPKVENNL